MVAELTAHYRRSGLGDRVLKKRLTGILQGIIGPIRERRAELSTDGDYVMDILRTGTTKGCRITDRTQCEVFDGLGLFRL